LDHVHTSFAPALYLLYIWFLFDPYLLRRFYNAVVKFILIIGLPENDSEAEMTFSMTAKPMTFTMTAQPNDLPNDGEANDLFNDAKQMT